jgi:hypothetical protein
MVDRFRGRLTVVDVGTMNAGQIDGRLRSDGIEGEAEDASERWR